MDDDEEPPPDDPEWIEWLLEHDRLVDEYLWDYSRGYTELNFDDWCELQKVEPKLNEDDLNEDDDDLSEY